MHGVDGWERAWGLDGGEEEEVEQIAAQGISHRAHTSPTTAPMLDESVIIQLVEMGFPMDACRKAVYYTGNSGAEAAMNWVMSHMDDPGRQGWVAGRAGPPSSPKHITPSHPQILQTPSSCLGPVGLAPQVRLQIPHQRTA